MCGVETMCPHVCVCACVCEVEYVNTMLIVLGTDIVSIVLGANNERHM